LNTRITSAQAVRAEEASGNFNEKFAVPSLQLAKKKNQKKLCHYQQTGANFPSKDQLATFY
jgi:hypothetical protein